MKVTILLGNGFDLNQGLKTSYKNFLSSYIKNNKNDSSTIRDFKKLLSTKRNLWSDFELLLGQITDKYSIEQKEQFLDAIDHMRHAMAAYLHRQSQAFKHKFHRYRKELKFSLENMSYEDGYMYPQAPILTVDRNTQYQFVVFNYNTIIYDLLNKIKRKESFRNHNIITDNIDTKKYLIHCDTSYGFILGVNDVSQINNVDFRNDPDICNALIKGNQRKIMCQKEDLADYIKDSDAVYIYGMSIGLTDKHYWEQLIQWLQSSQDKKLIISYYDKAITKIDPHKIDKAHTFLLNRLISLGLQKKSESQVQIVINPKIFNFTLINRNKKKCSKKPIVLFR